MRDVDEIRSEKQLTRLRPRFPDGSVSNLLQAFWNSSAEGLAESRALRWAHRGGHLAGLGEPFSHSAAFYPVSRGPPNQDGAFWICKYWPTSRVLSCLISGHDHVLRLVKAVYVLTVRTTRCARSRCFCLAHVQPLPGAEIPGFITPPAAAKSAKVFSSRCMTSTKAPLSCSVFHRLIKRD